MMNEKYQKTLDYMNKIINEDKISHAFLIECRNVPMYMNLIFPFIKSILNKYKYDENLDIDALVNSENYPELKIIRPINNVIRKEQLLELQSEFSIKPIYGKYLIIGLGTTYIMQSVIHILMNLKLWIRSDVNLPFVAEGSLYLLINCFTFAIILSVYRRKDINFEEPRKLNESKKFEKLNLF